MPIVVRFNGPRRSAMGRRVFTRRLPVTGSGNVAPGRSPVPRRGRKPGAMWDAMSASLRVCSMR
ncbi:hypothetical protein [Saccharopolyspora gloriosae]|uniref:hypothetical protein n=1 Tax=Saccharopolyspora gloriosae TaxID=455344 RepID=UPI001FB75815|nr:hypothetical protein [Saccharopolyspora gloriosae]